MKRTVWLVTLGILVNGSISHSTESAAKLIEKMPPVAITLPNQVPPMLSFDPKTDKAEKQFSHVINRLPLKHGTITKAPGKKSKKSQEIIFVREVRMGAEAQRTMQLALKTLISDKKQHITNLRSSLGQKGNLTTTPYMATAEKSIDPRKNLAYLNMQISALKNRVFNKKLQAFDLKVQMFNQGTMSLASYIELLTQMKDTSLGPKSKHDQIDFYKKIQRMEAKIDFKTVERERAQIIRRLVYRLNSRDQKDLRKMILAYRLGDVSHQNFYHYLQEACAKTGIKFESYSNLFHYLQYVLLSSQFEQNRFFTQLKELEGRRYNGLIYKPSERALVKQSSSLNDISKIVANVSASEEWAWSKNSRQ